MKSVVVPISQDGSATIPAEVLEHIVRGPVESVELSLRDDEAIEVRPHEVTLDGVFGPLPDSDEVPKDRSRGLGLAARLASAERSKRVLG